MKRPYKISKDMKELQMHKARLTRVKRYGRKYMSKRGIYRVKKNLAYGRRVRLAKLARRGY